MSSSIRSFSSDFEKLVEKQPNATAIILMNELSPVELSYLDLYRLIQRTVSFYQHERGLKKGDAVVALLPNSLEMVVTFLASVVAGLRFAPLSCIATPHEIERWIKLVKPAFTFGTDLLSDSSQNAVISGGSELIALKPDGLFEWLGEHESDRVTESGGAELLISTSGSTGEPKALVINADRLWSSGIAFANVHGLGERNLRLWNFLPMSYLGGLYNLAMIPLATGGSVVLDSPFNGSTFLNFWQTVDRYAINTLWLVPTIVNGLLTMARRQPKDFLEKICSKVNFAFLGTAPISLETKERFESVFGIPLLENFALSETTFISSEQLNVPNTRKEGTTGFKLPYVDIDLIFTEQPETISQLESFGEIRVKSPYLFTGYLQPDGTIHPARDSEGYFRTGDLGAFTPDGQLMITGRVRDILKKGGYMVSLREIENAAVQFDGVAEAAAVKISHHFYGESYNLYIVPEKAASFDQQHLLDQFIPYLHNQLVQYKWPEKISVLAALPKTSSGKVQKHLITGDTIGSQ